jgi:hypothetical protein
MRILSYGAVSALGLSLAFAIPAVARADDDDDRRERREEARERAQERREEWRERLEDRREEIRDRIEDAHDDHRRRWRQRHHGSRFGHNDWNFVVPHRNNHAGAYFSIGKLHFYTPSPIVPARPGVSVQVQKPAELRFGGFQRHSDLGGRLVYDANALCLEMHYNYRNNPGFAHAYREAYDILQAAKFIHAREHQGNHQAIRDRAAAVDRLFHHVQEQVANWRPTGNVRVGDDDLWGKIGNVEAIIHHLCWEVGVQPHHDEHQAPARPIDPNQPAPPPGL